MKKYALIDSNGNVLGIYEFESRPDDPLGKGWKWIDVMEDNPGEITEGQVISETGERIDHDILYINKEIQDIPITFDDINQIKKEKLEEIKPFIIKTGSTIYVVPSEQTVNNLSSLVSYINIMVANGETHTTLYRDANENNIDLTIVEIYELYQKVFLYNKQLTQASWLIKDDHNLPKNIKELREDIRWPD